MSATFQIHCPACNSKLNAKACLIGQTRNCPKCQTPVLIQQEMPQESSLQRFDLDEPVTTEPTTYFADNAQAVKVPQLVFNNRYFILGVDRIVAIWEGSKGWQVNVGSGFAPARNNLPAIPDQGVYAFVEIAIESGIPRKLQISKISTRGALTLLARDAHAILSKLEEPTDLTPAQKDFLLRHLRQIFMSTVLDDAQEVLNYLAPL